MVGDAHIQALASRRQRLIAVCQEQRDSITADVGQLEQRLEWVDLGWRAVDLIRKGGWLAGAAVAGTALWRARTGGSIFGAFQKAVQWWLYIRAGIDTVRRFMGK